MATLLPDSTIQSALDELPAWQLSPGSISRTVESATFPDAIALLQRIAAVAEAANHHPDIDVRWRKVTYTLSTHSAGGLTDLDFDLARRIDVLVDDSVRFD
ncbi:4a-hydroxytetrahydrobiopterin dehydratase [Rhodococcus erythropolis]